MEKKKKLIFHRNEMFLVHVFAKQKRNDFDVQVIMRETILQRIDGIK